jgi:hypothetical protein
MAFPQLLEVVSGSSVTAATTHTFNYTKSIKPDELLVFIAASPTASSFVAAPNNWRGTGGGTGSSALTVASKYANGQDETGSFTSTTGTAVKISWAILRFQTGSILNYHFGANGPVSQSTITPADFRAGSASLDYTILNCISTFGDATASAASVGATLVANVNGATDGASVIVQTTDATVTPWTNRTFSAITFSKQTNSMVNRTWSVTLAQPGNRILRKWQDHRDTGHNISSTAPLVAGVAQTFVGDGSRIDRIGVNMRRNTTITGDLSCKLYLVSSSIAPSYRNGSVPTGSLLVSASNSISMSNGTLDSSRWQYEEFLFNPPFRTDSDQLYALSLESSNIAGTLRIGRGSANTGPGNSATSSNSLTDWSGGQVDIVYYIQVPQYDTPYYFNSNFISASISASNSGYFDGWYSLTSNPALQTTTETKDVKLVDNSIYANTYVTYSIVNDSELNIPVLFARTVGDNPPLTTNARAQFNMEFYNTPYQDTEYKARLRMKFHPDIEWLRTNLTASVGPGGGDRNTFFNIWETWTESGIPTYFPDGDSGGSARWTIGLWKNTGTLANPQSWSFAIRADYMQPNSVRFNSMWTTPGSQSNGTYTSSVIVPPAGEWFYLDWYFKKGTGSFGRNTVKLIRSGSTVEETLFDIQDNTQYPGYQQLTQDVLEFVKVYAGDPILNLVSSSNRNLAIYYSDFTWYNLNYPAEPVVGSGPVTIFLNGTATLRNYRWVRV